MLLADIFILLTDKMQNNFLIGANLKPQRLLAQQLSYYLLNKDWQQKVLLKTIRGGGGGNAPFLPGSPCPISFHIIY